MRAWKLGLEERQWSLRSGPTRGLLGMGFRSHICFRRAGKEELGRTAGYLAWCPGSFEGKVPPQALPKEEAGVGVGRELDLF